MSYPENKINRVVATAKDHGWNWNITLPADDGKIALEYVYVLCSRGQEEMLFEWEGQRSTSVRYTYAGDARQMHNVAAALRQMAAEPDAARAIKRGRRSRGAETSALEPVISHHETVDDIDLLDRLCGRRIVWRGQHSEEPHETRVLASNKGSKHYYVSNGQVHFLDAYGFRSVRINSIIQVAR